jgi:hypothetical protein
MNVQFGATVAAAPQFAGKAEAKAETAAPKFAGQVESKPVFAGNAAGQDAGVATKLNALA